MSERKLARVEVIDSLQPIEGADRIEIAMIGGWQVVVQKGLHNVGDQVAYFEVDSLLPTDNPAFASLTSISSKLLFEINGKGYARIKTIKLRGQISQGYIVPLRDINNHPVAVYQTGTDLTQELGVLKYEAREEREMNNAGSRTNTRAPGTMDFPSFIPKTDQNRIQNVVPRFNQARDAGEEFEKTFKLDGSSMTVYMKDGVNYVASRNVAFHLQVQNKGLKRTLLDFVAQVKKVGWKRAKWVDQIPAANNAFTQAAKNSGALMALTKENRNIAVQGELVGPNIQKNFEGVDSNQFFVYDVYLIDEKRYMLPNERYTFCGKHDLNHVPIAGIDKLKSNVAETIADADGPSGLKGKYREGYVYKSMERDFSFKVISNSYLLKEK